MKEIIVPAPLFGAEFVEAHRRRYGHKAPQERPLTYDNAVGEEFADRRAWLEEQVRHLSPKQAEQLAGRVWNDDWYWPIHFEMAVGAALRHAGFRMVYDRAWNRLTPDWTVLSPDGKPLCLVEVYTASPPRDTYNKMRRWHQLTQRIKTIPVGVVLRLEGTGCPIQAPDAHVAKKITQELRTALCSPWQGPRIRTSYGYNFLVQADRYGNAQRSPFGLYACFDAPSSIAGEVNAEQIIGPVKDKISKYRQVAEEHDLPLIVAVGSHRFTGLTLTELDDLLAGKQTITFQFNPGDTYIGEAMHRSVKWDMPDDLSGLMWVDNEFPFAVTSRPNLAARQPMPIALAGLGD